MKQSSAAHGDPWGKYRKIEVAFIGEWTGLASRMQPILTDPGFRKSSVETYYPATGRVRQVHTGLLGTKTVERTRPETRVAFNGANSSDQEVLDAAALVVDAYKSFVFGASWLSRHGTDFRMVGVRMLDGKSCHLIAGRVSPGFGNSEEDHFIAWIDRENSLMKRIQISLNGLESTRGADVDVVFSDFRKTADGSVWPVAFLEKIQRPVVAKAHEWRMTSLKLNGVATSF